MHTSVLKNFNSFLINKHTKKASPVFRRGFNIKKENKLF